MIHHGLHYVAVNLKEKKLFNIFRCKLVLIKLCRTYYHKVSVHKLSYYIIYIKNNEGYFLKSLQSNINTLAITSSRNYFS